MAGFHDLPSEIILHLASFLEPREIVRVQLLCQKFLQVCRDGTLWQEQCFFGSSYLNSVNRHQRLRTADAGHAGSPPVRAQSQTPQHPQPTEFKKEYCEKKRIFANWDPSYKAETVDWYAEYISRHAPIQLSWLQQPRSDGADGAYLETRSTGLYTPAGESTATTVVAPLADGGICLWDICGANGRRGRIIGRSKPGLLSASCAQDVCEAVNPGVTETISVDSNLGRAYVAVQCRLVELDLETLQIVNEGKYPFSITALSKARHPVPLSVGTNLSLELYDSRIRIRSPSDTPCWGVDVGTVLAQQFKVSGGFRQPGQASRYAHLHQPGPLSILHMPTSEAHGDDESEIYVAGRFTSILNYDRRNFPRIKGTIHSGAQLCGLTSLPYPFASMETDLATRGKLSMAQMDEYKSRSGKTLIACGEYRSKGSLEVYGLPSSPAVKHAYPSSAGHLQNSTLKNRQTSSNSKLLSVSNHGTKIVVSDGGGNLKWFERDGVVEVRRFNLLSDAYNSPKGLFGTLRDHHYMEPGSEDIARKILSTQESPQSTSCNGNNIVLWTGEKIAMLRFSTEPGFTADSFEEHQDKSPEDILREGQEQDYACAFRRALEQQANEVRYMRGLGRIR